MRIYTSRYANGDLADLDLVKVGITIGNPRFKLPYEREHLRLLAPARHVFRIGDQEEFRQAFEAQLAETGVEVIRRRLLDISEAHDGRDLVLLCFEDLTKPGLYCHRTHFADFWQDQTGAEVKELALLPAPQGSLL